jgi:hypothetical protein
MSADSEKLYTAKETASALGLGAAMLRRYASTYETVSGDVITVHRRDGRLFTENQVKVLTAARSLVMLTNVDVETAVKQTLDRPLEAAPVALAQSSALGSEALLKALTDAQREANAPLLGELRSIRESLERLEAGGQIDHLDKPGAASQLEKLEYGLVVRLALWLERVLRR